MKPRVFLRTILPLFALLLSVSALAQPDKTFPSGEFGVDYNVTDANGKKQGKWVRVYEGGAIYYKGQFTDDVPQGEFWFWYDSGEAMSKVNHLDGTKHMDVVNYHKNGYPMSAGIYKEVTIDGKVERVKDGEWEFYNDKGYLKSKENFVMGSQEGLATSYFETGKVLLEVNYKNGMKNGQWTEYFEDGQVKGTGSYKDDQYHGDYTLYWAGRKKLVSGSYFEGTKDGLWIQFNKDGSMQLTTKYDKGEEKGSRRENGEFTDYYPSGIPSGTYEYEDGEKSGPFQEWYDMGEWIQKPMDTPLPGGGIQFKESLVGTQIKREGDYLEGKLEGPITYYDEKGRITRVENWVDGELESTEER
ncbi:toxin-antitoxin system YwqK family antitoxin [Sanyastnella coralliicola]|uniref:toxin-antitoxin system YwqK family antitoxin n=1 Tax=Sanyastnella coralliicola TaxID=3069118 RepID=UPI0027B930F5|nr:hypothetical protein [Longitalea sp. SCSIO 12813]